MAGRVAFIGRHWQRFDVSVAWRDRRGDEVRFVHGSRSPNGQRLFERKTVLGKCDRYFAEITMARTITALNNFHVSYLTGYHCLNGLNGYSFFEPKTFISRHSEP